VNHIQQQFLESLLTIDKIKAKEILESKTEHTTAISKVNSLIIPVLEKIGSLWEQGEAALSQVYMSGRICEELVDDILPEKSSQRTNQPKMAIVVLDDYHFLGKRIVYSMLRASGYELKDYGRKTVDEIIIKLKKDDIRILLISALMLPSALQVKILKRKLKEEGIDDIKLIVGGAPFRIDSKLADEVGADAYGKDASDVVSIISKIIKTGETK
jgi:methanogenic corrinoid protein MtbC1